MGSCVDKHAPQQNVHGTTILEFMREINLCNKVKRQAPDNGTNQAPQDDKGEAFDGKKETNKKESRRGSSGGKKETNKKESKGGVQVRL